MKKIRAAVVGYGNIGKFTLEALEAAPDFEVAGIVRRNGAENKPAELADYHFMAYGADHISGNNSQLHVRLRV